MTGAPALQAEAEAAPPASAAPSDSGHSSDGDGEPGGARKRRRRGRRGGRRRRRGGEFGDETATIGTEMEGMGQTAVPIAETVEYVPPEPPSEREEIGDIEAALAAPPAPAEMGMGAEMGPVSAAAEPRPIERHGEPAHEEDASRHHASTELPTHDVTGPPTNPKRGWWRRVIDR